MSDGSPEFLGGSESGPERPFRIPRSAARSAMSARLHPWSDPVIEPSGSCRVSPVRFNWNPFMLMLTPVSRVAALRAALLFAGVLPVLLAWSPPVDAVTVDAFFSENVQYQFDGLPNAGNRILAAEEVRLADGFDQGLYLLASGSAADVAGLWRVRGLQSSPIGLLNISGPAGPGRSGLPDVFYPVATSPFRAFEQGNQGDVVFFGKAADPALGASFASRGLWLNQGAGNLEIARANTTELLGPGIDANTVFENSDTFVRRILFANNGQLVAFARVGQGSFDEALLVRRNGVWVPCAVDDSLVTAWSPGLSNLSYDNLTTGYSFMVNPAGDVFGMNRLSNAQYGVWEYCQGAPQLRALEGATGSFGPGMGADSRFATMSRSPLPLLDDALILYGTAETSGQAGAPQFTGWFRNQSGQNGPIALLTTNDATGPQINGATFTSLPDQAMTQGVWMAFAGTVSGPSGNVSGLWRWSAATGLEPVALIRTGAYSPTVGTYWTALSDFFITERGEMILYATVCDRTADNLGCVNGSNRNEFWSKPRQGISRRLLGPGDTVRFRTVAGAQQATISTVDLAFTETIGGSGYESTSRDFWVNRLGVLQAAVTTNGFTGVMHVRAQAFDPQALFGNGFE